MARLGEVLTAPRPGDPHLEVLFVHNSNPASVIPDQNRVIEGLGREDLFTPIAKAWSTDVGVEVASLGVQVHGGMGFIEETGAAQHYRDARIAPIYEGTNGIQANALVGRKVGLAVLFVAFAGSRPPWRLPRPRSACRASPRHRRRCSW